jgi:hypothetical protein
MFVFVHPPGGVCACMYSRALQYYVCMRPMPTVLCTMQCRAGTGMAMALFLANNFAFAPLGPYNIMALRMPHAVGLDIYRTAQRTVMLLSTIISAVQYRYSTIQV